MGTIKIAPVNRMEGHMDLDAQTDGSKVVTSVDAKAVMFRGLENIMVKRDPRDAPIITCRACGVCPITHGAASSKATGEAYGFKVDASHMADSTYKWGKEVDVPANAVLIRNLAMGANYLMSHILHFYHLVALDFVDVTGTGLIPKGFACPTYDNNYYARGIDPVLQTGGLGQPAYTVNNLGNLQGWSGATHGALGGDLTPYFAGQYVRALKARRMCQQLGALFAGKMPHASCYTPGCVTTKAYDPNTTKGKDAMVRQKVHELIYGGPCCDPDATSYSVSNPHPESLLGFIGKPSDFWTWAGDHTGSLGTAGFSPEFLPPWAQVGVPAAATGPWNHGGTFCFDTVAAAHCFPEYFWIGQGYGRYLSWGAFEGADVMGFSDGRLFTRGRTHVPYNPNGSGTPYSFTPLNAQHFNPSGTSWSSTTNPKGLVQEYVDNSWFDDAAGTGRHPWKGKTKGNPNKSGAYSFAKSPRYHWASADGGPDDWVPYEVGPLARGMANARGLSTPGGPATLAEVLAVDAGNAFAYYPSILADVDATLAPGGSAIGVLPSWGANLAAHLTYLQTAGPVFYLPTNAFSPVVLANGFHGDFMGGSTLDRIAARTLETYFVAMQLMNWFNAIDPDQKVCVTRTFGKKNKCAPNKANGCGLTEAPRGALAHWIKIGKKTKKSFKGKVHRYQIITPTAWNISPKDHNGAMGPQERTIWGTPVVDESEPIEILRVIHSFDNCLACTVHLMNAKNEKVAEVAVDPAK